MRQVTYFLRPRVYVGEALRRLARKLGGGRRSLLFCYKLFFLCSVCVWSCLCGFPLCVLTFCDGGGGGGCFEPYIACRRSGESSMIERAMNLHVTKLLEGDHSSAVRVGVAMTPGVNRG